jgi:plastocyanin
MIHATAHDPAMTPAPAAVTRSIQVIDSGYDPAALVVAPGTEVTWTNAGRNRHTVTADQGGFGSRPLATGDRFAIAAPATPGVYAYHCTFHSYMHGSLTVSLVSLERPAPVRVGRPVTLTGTVPGVAAGTPVGVEGLAAGAWAPVGQAVTDASGAFSVTTGPLTGTMAFRAVAAGSPSPLVRARVVPLVTVRRRGKRLRVRIAPSTAGARARLQRLDLDTYRWTTLRSLRVAAGRTSFVLRRPGVYRVEAPAHGGLASTDSRVVEYRPGAFRQ